jgi:hypothetical protein
LAIGWRAARTNARRDETRDRLKLDAIGESGGSAARQFPVESAVMLRTRPVLHSRI